MSSGADTYVHNDCKKYVAYRDHLFPAEAEGSALAHFEDKAGLVQVEFEANIPWVIDKAL